MGGATLTIASAPKPQLPVRSHSSPDLVLLSSHYPVSEAAPSKGLLPLPDFDVPPLDDSIFLKLKDSSVTTVSSLPNHAPRTSQEALTSGAGTGRKTDAVRPHKWRLARNDDALADLASPHQSYSGAADSATAVDLSDSTGMHRSRTASGSYPNLGSLSWLPGSRSRNSSSEDEGSEVFDGAAEDDKVLSPRRIWGRDKPGWGIGASKSSDSLSTTTRALTRANGYLTKIKQKPQTVFVRSGLGAAPATRSSETVRAVRDGVSSAYASSTDVSAVDDSASTPITGSERGSEITAASIVRDHLWSPFRDLDGAYHAFVGKQTTAHRMTIVKTALVPFLNRYACDPSNKDTDALLPEDVERRATIMGKWWAVMLQLLDENSGRVAWGQGIAATLPPEPTPEPLAGLDRPIVLGAITMLMARPEWRLGTPHFRPLAARCPSEKVRARSDSGALSLSDTSFIARSTERNVHDIFLSNLLSQLAVVINKLSHWKTPEALVTFAGKTLAYGFFFVPGVAQIVVRLWGLDAKPSLITRVVDEFGLPRTSLGESDDIVALFPPSLGSLGYSSVKTLTEKLRRPPKFPPQTLHIPWYGPWVSRWRGGDTNLFFVFCKHFYIISEEFMPAGLPLIEKARAPAFVLIHAQLLSIFDDTINRQVAFEALMRPSFPESIHGADAALTHMGPLLPNANMFRGMDENCIIMLLRDFLSTANCLSGARYAFAEAFMRLSKAATKRTGQYDHNAQHLLCDFLQEALQIYHVAPSSPGDAEIPTFPPLIGYVDWTFWFDVCKRMLSNNNTMSEIRTLSFLFSTWDIIAADPSRKEALCVDWLLEEEVFAKFFCNWCPMVRAYYLRLLCWRICRDSGSSNELDTRIWILVSKRLRDTYSQYLWLKQKAERSASALPSTTPSPPQPGKRFMIVRNEVMGASHQGLLASPQRTNPHPQAEFRDFDGYNSQKFGTESDSVDNVRDAQSNKRWSLLGKLRGLNAPGSEGRPRNYGEELEKTRRDTANSRQSSEGPPLPPKDDNPSRAPPSPGSDSTGSVAIFDVEQYVFRFTLQNIPWHHGVPVYLREQVITRPRLPAPAQARVNSKLASAGYCDEEDTVPLSPGRPPSTRAISGWMQGGLISEARNAQRKFDLDDTTQQCLSPGLEPRGGPSFGGDSSSSELRLIGELPFENSTTAVLKSETRRLEPPKPKHGESKIIAVEPTGTQKTTSRYAGRALAEWSLVVSECNSFVDRRRGEGVLGLRDVEVPILAAEGLRRAG
ncbi:hypothetical protein MCOR27_001742 [Pyricularia oryzae]|uniref:DUF1765-domain-containing protein n=1 Tax=Pyricularia oryzae TaxID=318829 RepID=A0A4P7N2Q2_PYROR|nr:hypothetical protein MCOR02_001301 [Pyricularia oryzae]KAI6286670.1 hypothetical protein MCOR27_001742 [Pyricularia oryzae]KAI6297659.1 hypothetical protein MCOR34_009333 [Pyricularia oryzae]KAI6362520.1 hypothetical protein MCOR32_008468 [Pyricularia oryzae]KAI6450284.1 hypothetical protein MCOR22_001930 [Pyricularia oryzae]